MSKRRLSELSGAEKDEWDTPHAAVLPLVRFLDHNGRYSEPCAGAGDLARHLRKAGIPVGEAYDIAPRAADVDQADVLLRVPEYPAIANPPFSKAALLPLLRVSVKWPAASCCRGT